MEFKRPRSRDDLVAFAEKPKCPKCKCGEIGLTYCTAGVCKPSSQRIEYLSCRCGRCGHEWFMHVADADED